MWLERNLLIYHLSSSWYFRFFDGALCTTQSPMDRHRSQVVFTTTTHKYVSTYLPKTLLYVSMHIHISTQSIIRARPKDRKIAAVWIQVLSSSSRLEWYAHRYIFIIILPEYYTILTHLFMQQHKRFFFAFLFFFFTRRTPLRKKTITYREQMTVKCTYTSIIRWRVLAISYGLIFNRRRKEEKSSFVFGGFVRFTYVW